ncbi:MULTISPECIES: hypothetical protein [unclassified Janibacter]|uniref:hypothetical protein n=1 Tax=unclassified Janibacter TaxID=2649294 RepID=UPI003CFDC98B
MSTTFIRLAEEVPVLEENHLPFPPVVFAVIALLAFAFALAVLWSFRNTAQKVPAPGSRARAAQGDGHGSGHH